MQSVRVIALMLIISGTLALMSCGNATITISQFVDTTR